MYRIPQAQSDDIAATVAAILSMMAKAADRSRVIAIRAEGDCDWGRREWDRDRVAKRLSELKRQKQRARLKRVRALYSLNFIETEFFRTRSRLAQSSLRKKFQNINSRIVVGASNQFGHAASNTRSAIAGSRNNNHEIGAVKADHAELRTKKSGA